MMKHLAGWTAAVLVFVAASAARADRFPIPGHDETVVPALGEKTYSERFMGGEIALVAVAGDGDTRLEVDVYDHNGNLVDSDTGTTCLVKWVPRRTGLFTIKVINLGFDANAYALKTN